MVIRVVRFARMQMHATLKKRDQLGTQRQHELEGQCLCKTMQ